jgi:hypothetical protein
MNEEGEQLIQACGSFDILTGEYSLSIASGRLVVSFDFLKKDDIEHLISCLSCMIATHETENHGTQR